MHIGSHRRFEEASCLPSPGKITVKLNGVRSAKMSVSIEQLTRRHKPENSILKRGCENQKYSKVVLFEPFYSHKQFLFGAGRGGICYIKILEDPALVSVTLMNQFCSALHIKIHKFRAVRAQILLVHSWTTKCLH